MEIQKSHTIETERLILRLPSLDDIPTTFSASRYEGFNDGTLWDQPGTEAELIIPLQNAIMAWESGERYSFSIDKKEDRTFMGRVSIKKEIEPGTWSLGFWLHPGYQGKGYMNEASKAIIRFGFEVLHAEKIIACHAIWNKASEKVLKNNGMRFLRYIEKGFQKNGVWMDENLLGIERAEWEKQLPASGKL